MAGLHQTKGGAICYPRNSREILEVNFSKLEVYKPSSEHFSSFPDEPVETENVDSILRMVSSGGVAAGYYSMKQRNHPSSSCGCYMFLVHSDAEALAPGF